MLKWLWALLASSFTFALADVICDVCITEHEEEERAQKVETASDDEEPDQDSNGIEMSSYPVAGGHHDQRDSQQTPLQPRYKALAGGASTDAATPSFDSAVVAEEQSEQGLTGAQDAAIAGLVTVLSAAVTVGVWTAQSARSGAGGGASSLSALRWRPTTHLQWWLAMVGGACNFLHYFFLLKAFEGAPSTVILPLVQVASVSVLLGSSVIALYRHEAWITPTHMLAYVLMFVGGILPACAGQLSALVEREFWRQSFVGFSIAAEFALGVHDLMLSGCSYTAPPKAQPPQQQQLGGSGGTGGSSSSGARAAGEGGGLTGGEEYAESFEFFVWSRLAFIGMFLLMYFGSAQLYAELRELLSGKISRKYIGLSAISEGLTIVGFYLASIAYGLFYQVRAALPSSPTTPLRPSNHGRARTRPRADCRGGGDLAGCHACAAPPAPYTLPSAWPKAARGP